MLPRYHTALHAFLIILLLSYTYTRVLSQTDEDEDDDDYESGGSPSNVDATSSTSGDGPSKEKSKGTKESNVVHSTPVDKPTSGNVPVDLMGAVLDEDEFEMDSPPISNAAQNEPHKFNESSTRPPRPEPLTYELELGALVIFAIYLLNFFYGRYVNDQIAQAWVAAIEPVLKKQFALIGEDLPPAPKLRRECSHEYSIYATGREHCKGASLTLFLRHRQDLVSVFYDLLFPSEDQMIMDIQLLSNTVPESGLCFAVMRKKDIKRLKEECPSDIGVGKEVKNTELLSNFPKSLSVISDCPDVAKDFLTDAFCSAVSEDADGAKLFRSAHFTDKMGSRPYYTELAVPQAGRIVIAVPPSSRSVDHADKLDDLVNACLRLTSSFAKTCTKVKTNPALVKEISQLRKSAPENSISKKEKHEKLMEKSMKAKEEKLRKQKLFEETLSPEEQTKREEKRRLKELRDMEKRRSKVLKV